MLKFSSVKLNIMKSRFATLWQFMMTLENTRPIAKSAVLSVSSLCAKVFATVFSEAQWSSMHTHPMCQNSEVVTTTVV